METKAFAYLRVSGRGQLEGDGLPRQREAIKKYAASNQVKILRWFEEKGVSGIKDLSNRPALQELLVALHANGTQTVLIEKLDRLARDLMVQETIIGDLRKYGFRLVSVTEPDLCGDDPSRKLVRQMFGAIAEYDRAMIVLKLRAARQRVRAKTGRCEGRKPFGTRPGEGLTLKRMRSLRAEGNAYHVIAMHLVEEELPARDGAAWYAAGVRRILKREGIQ